MRLCTTANETVRRTWTVELRPQSGGPALHCPQCTASSTPVPAASARSTVLAHLARHARRAALPGHLRICQCRQHGCHWHPRHRGCAGPILLALTRERSGRTWRLADTCAACAGATAYTAVVPDTTITTTANGPAPSDRGPSRRRRHSKRPGGLSEQLRVQEMLSYLAAVLPRGASSEARLLALQCALRTDSRGQTHLPAGLLRGMLLRHDPAPRQELETACWLRPLTPADNAARNHARTVQLLDPAVLTQAPSRTDRRQAADWALRIIASPPPGAQSPPARLTHLALTAHRLPGAAHSSTETDRLSRACGLEPHNLEQTLDQLVLAGIITQWQFSHDSEDVHWTPALPAPHTSRAKTGV
ncbi:hypothetical protein [Streptomyces sp. IB2014 016-6]|uniref:hypothetical protein n=1 Tax=Streptomyces sp. IB2014 016-6 TaxID=2517818 RepID=UPI0011C81BCC|nr:hypothetical protein [Streptomyces sp. IB2014 016-6]TXL84717.1 hypothetical protein EW053_33350 [Streptomyces sp. IB2014 016-6]